MKKIVIVAGYARSLSVFRGDLIRSWISKGYEVYAVAPDSGAEDNISKLGVKEFYCIQTNRTGTNILSDLKFLYKLYKLLKQLKPDVVLGYTIKPVIYGSIAAKLAKVKNINAMITGAGYLFVSQTLKAKILKFVGSLLYKIGLKCADNVIFQNYDDLNEFVDSRLVSRDKCYKVNGSGVNMERFARKPLPEEISFMMVSRALYSKGVFEYFEAAEIVKKSYPEVNFYLVGAFGDNADCIPYSKAKSYIDSGVINYMGRVDDVPKMLERCSVYVLPSYREGTPRSVLEAMSVGRAVITTDAPGCRETVVDGDNGFLIPTKSVDVLVEKMVWFINNRDNISIMGDRSYQICNEKFEVSRVNLSMNKILGV